MQILLPGSWFFKTVKFLAALLLQNAYQTVKTFFKIKILLINNRYWLVINSGLIFRTHLHPRGENEGMRNVVTDSWRLHTASPEYFLFPTTRNAKLCFEKKFLITREVNKYFPLYLQTVFCFLRNEKYYLIRISKKTHMVGPYENSSVFVI